MLLQLFMMCALLLSVVEGLAQLSGEMILKKVDVSFSGVQDYSVVLDITADMERMTIPPMQVHMYYKQPDKFHFESENFAMLPREGLAFSASRVLSRFTVEGVTEQMSPQGKQFELLLRPKDERARATKLLLYIDGTRWKPMKIVSSLFDGRTMTAVFQYEKQNNYLMPSTLIVQFTSSSADTTEQTTGMEEAAPVQRPPMPRKGTISIRYSEYKINTGLSDDIFDKKR